MTRTSAAGIFHGIVSEPDSGALKHRHDIGHPDHGPSSTELTTKGIQLALALTILGTVALLVYIVSALGSAP